MTAIQNEIKNLLLSLGVSDVGFCHTEDGPGGLHNAVSIVVHLSDAIIDEIEDKPTHTYFNHYRSVNAFIDHCLLRVGLLLQQNGYKYITVASSQSINDEGWFYRGRYSHKKIACFCTKTLAQGCALAQYSPTAALKTQTNTLKAPAPTATSAKKNAQAAQ